MSAELIASLRFRIARLSEIAATADLAALEAERAEIDRGLDALQGDLAVLSRDRERAQDARRTAEAESAHFRQLLEYGPDGYLVTNRLGVIQEANGAAVELLNVPRPFLVGKPLSIFIEHDDLPSFRRRLDRLRAEDRVEWPVRLRPRERPSFEGTLAVSAFPESDDRPPALRWLIRDVSARHRAEELANAHEFMKELLAAEQRARAESEAAEQRFRTLAHAGHVLAASLDSKMALSGVADLVVPGLADLFIGDVFTGETLETAALAHATTELVDRLRRVWPPAAALTADHPIAEMLRTRQPLLVERLSPEWLERWAGAEALPVWRAAGLGQLLVVPLTSHESRHGVLTFGLGTMRPPWDTADRQLLEDIAQRAGLALHTAWLFHELEVEHQRKDQFLAMLAHELRNPLAAMTSASEAMERGDPAHRAHLEGILRRQIAHLGRLVNDLLDVSRVRFGRVLLHRRRIDLRELTRHSLEILRASGQAEHHRVSLTTAPEPIPVSVDPDRMEQVVANIVDNALKYTPQGGSVDLAVGTEAGQGVVRVRDSGIGIDPEYLPRIFDVFSRAEGTRDARSGLGLGLTVVRDLVSQHGGSVEATSAGVGQGSEFVIRLPLEDAVDTPVAVPEPSAAGSGGSILLVEDNEDAREAMRILLELSGFEVQVAVDGREAIDAIRRSPPEVALIDIGLPDMEGHEVARVVRADSAAARVYLIALTGYGQALDRQRALAAGFDAHLVKPVDPDALLRTLAQARGGRAEGQRRASG